ncbi:hypothetical protein MIMGU_mgv1a015945mg [Erythranthe guttata]|uniref:Uncharacterized protein n=1 Tax=Erythranthe guttata TaxID=4155 RepID=A0A022RTD2_ERYGU|nr:PREDICTED: uncharacterized protein LOC105951799 [Erythranthe guttata]EYU42963.1 hypothetical protein MIMGU_mgv1a015945mg [Erythranthe guttata]|eukprot:XP_012830705.1 PREDICTED: uncharacterized protein LOC105951799 [Erythranthe guttata]
MMVCNSLSSSTLPNLIPFTYQPPAAAESGGRRRHVERILQLSPCKRSRPRGVSVVTRAAPTATSYIFAFIFPLSLLAVTIFTSVRVVDKLDEKYLEELAVDQAILEAKENSDEVSEPSVKEAAPARSRNRPKREVQQTST